MPITGSYSEDLKHAASHSHLKEAYLKHHLIGDQENNQIAYRPPHHRRKTRKKSR
ncbi:hypothetical protein SynSYN20_03370 [Synechococcus sp. SYN20]|nr:hypothetical protein SynSYN20_03370 [Synechococcus sp. SYN20]